MNENQKGGVKSRGVRLFQFLNELSKLKLKIVYDIEKYEETIWLKDIPLESGFYCIAKDTSNESSDIWVEAKKVNRSNPPVLSETLKKWIKESDIKNSNCEPRLNEELVQVVEGKNEFGEVTTETIIYNLADSPSVKEEWETYYQQKWIPWSDKDKIDAERELLYKRLYHIYKNQLQLSETYEVIMSFGLLRWQREKRSVKRHIVTTKVNISLDSNTGKITVSPSLEKGAELKLEQEMIPQENALATDKVKMLEDDLEAIGDNVWDDVKLKNVLQRWGNQLSSDCHVSEGLEMNTSSQSKINLDFCPAIILRKKSDSSFVKLFHDISNQIQSSDILNPNIENLVSIKDESFEEYNNGNKLLNSIDNSSEIYFPLATNNEQLQIIRKLEKNEGVLVKGPPGTGKSHTITNLICHLLATGKSVLVTSHTNRALKVLHDKMPEELKPLCVSVLGEDLASFRALENSVQGILNKYQVCDGKNYNFEGKISNLEDELHENREQIAVLKKKLISIRELDTDSYEETEKYKGKLGEISRFITQDQKDFDWFPDEILKKPQRIDESKLEELIYLIGSLDRKVEQSIQGFNFSSLDVPSPAKFKMLSQENKPMTLNDSELNLLSIYSDLDEEYLFQIKELLNSSTELLSILKNFKYDWVGAAKRDIFSERDRKWSVLLETSKEALETLSKIDRKVYDFEVTGLENKSIKDCKRHISIIRDLVNQRKKPGIFSSSEIKEAAYIFKSVRVDGRPCVTLEALDQLQQKITVALSLEKLNSYWEDYIVPKGNEATRVAEYEDFCEPLEKMLTLLNKIESLRGCNFIFSEPKWEESEDVFSHLKVLDYIRSLNIELDRKNEVENLHIQLSSISENYNLCFLDKMKTANIEKNPELYLEAFTELEHYKTFFDQINYKNEVIDLIHATAPKFAESLKEFNLPDEWANKIKIFNEAAEWRFAKSWLNGKDKSNDFRKISQALDLEVKKEQNLIASLAGELAWKACFQNLKETHRQHLIAWANAVKKIGKGTGRWAGKHRKDARNHMKGCREAIPAWIMPIHRVVENVKIQPDLYDVVIVDEASQSGPEALFLQYISKQIIVVGDDKQIAPEGVGQDLSTVNQLREKLIFDLPFKDQIGPGSSFFDYMRIKFDSQISLREHFRCMPEIIQFSNNLCYQSEPLIPLRQFGENKITPVVDTFHVEGGYISGGSTKKINSSEAKQIVKRVQDIVIDPKFKGKTIGVISLMGIHQAKYIESLIMEALDEKTIESRKIICGDAYAFQGDERDIIILSMVSSTIGKNNEDLRVGVLSKASDERRFNVAASRARDQLILFHSVALNDLSAKCLRHQLLSYCLSPKIEQTTIGDLNIDELRKISRSADRSISKSVEPFDSWFEIDVFFKIHDRGYRVIPQFQIDRKSIDLVVEGMQGRIAVECDGDYWHGPEAYAKDLERQRQLERCGFKFVRIRESVFYADQENALKDLWSLLDKLKVVPGVCELETEKIGVGKPGAVIKESVVIESQPTYGVEDIVSLAPSEVDEISEGTELTSVSSTGVESDEQSRALRKAGYDAEPMYSKIKEVLSETPNLKAREIAKMLNLPKKKVNSYLHSNLDSFSQNDKFEWMMAG